MTDNVKRIQGALKENGLDAVLITSTVNRFYATGFRSSAGEIVVTPDDAVLYIDSRYYEEASANIKNARVEMIRDRSKTFEVWAEYMSSHGIKTLGFEDGAMSYAQYARYAEKLPVELRLAQKMLSTLRAVKSREELEIMIRAQRVAEKAFNMTVPLIRRGMTERELQTELFCNMLRCGAETCSFESIVVTGAHSSVPHGQADDRKIGDGFLTIDFGVVVDGYCSDTTRTLCVGEPTEEMRKVYDTVLKAQEAAIEAAKAGMTGMELDGVARKVIADAGYGEYFTHSLSHGLGIEVHEAPNASPSAMDVLPVGAVISVEPGIYIPGKFGVRIEDVIWLREDGCEDITDLPKALTVL